MAKLADAISEMTRKLSGKLDTVIERTEQVKQTTKAGFGQTTDKLAEIHLTDVAGYAAVKLSVDSVEDAVGLVGQRVGTLDTTMQRLTNATVQLDLERALAEVQGPLALFKAFETEINERHQMAQQSANSIYMQYMQLHDQVNKGYEGKLKTIGEHIYAIYQGDFEPYAERPLSEDPGELTDLVRGIESKVIESRSTALDRQFDHFVSGALEPMLGALSALRQEIGEKFDHDALESGGVQRALAVPVLGIEESQGNEWRLLVDAQIEVTAPKDAAQAAVSLTTPEHLRAWQGELTASWTSRIAGERTQVLEASALDLVKRELAALGAEGIVPDELVPDLQAYVDAFGLEVISVDGGGKA